MNDDVDPQVAQHLRRTLTAAADTTPRPIPIASSMPNVQRPGRERLLMRAAAVALVVGGVGGIFAVAQHQRVAPATSVPPAPTEPGPEPIDDDPGVPGGEQCEVLSAEAERVAVANDPYGGADYEWWVAPTTGGGRSDTVVQVDAEGQVTGGLGGSLACTPTPRTDIEWFGGGGQSGPPPLVSHGGHVSVKATAVVLTFPGQEPVELPVNPDGYFLTILPEHPTGPFSTPERIDALGSDGRIVATTQPTSAGGN